MLDRSVTIAGVKLNFDLVPTVTTCGRDTQKQTPCKRDTEIFMPACLYHVTEEERREGLAIYRAWYSGLREGQRRARDAFTYEIERLTELIERQGGMPWRYREGEGQLVEVNGRPFLWMESPDLELGDRVILPMGRSYQHGYRKSRIGTVTLIGTRYNGPVQVILRRTSELV